MLILENINFTLKLKKIFFGNIFMVLNLKLTTLCILSSMLIACGGGSSDHSSNTTPPKTDTSTTTPPTPNTDVTRYAYSYFTNTNYKANEVPQPTLLQRTPLNPNGSLNLANTQIIDTLPNAKVNSLNLFNAENGTVYAYVNHGDGYLYGYKINQNGVTSKLPSIPVNLNSATSTLSIDQTSQTLTTFANKEFTIYKILADGQLKWQSTYKTSYFAELNKNIIEIKNDTVNNYLYAIDDAGYLYQYDSRNLNVGIIQKVNSYTYPIQEYLKPYSHNLQVSKQGRVYYAMNDRVLLLQQDSTGKFELVSASKNFGLILNAFAIDETRNKIYVADVGQIMEFSLKDDGAFRSYSVATSWDSTKDPSSSSTQNRPTLSINPNGKSAFITSLDKIQEFTMNTEGKMMSVPHTDQTHGVPMHLLTVH